METRLHQQLKEQFRQPESEIEVRLDRFRIDVVNGNRLIEIQRSGLSTIKKKSIALLDSGFELDVVKPVVLRKRLVKLKSAKGKVIETRWSPKRGSIWDVFDELIHFTNVFPHPNLQLLVPIISIVETRYPGHGRRRRRRAGDFIVKEREILEFHDSFVFSGISDLQGMLPENLPCEFDTLDLAQSLQKPRHEAQKIAYVMKKMGAIATIGKRGRSWLYRLSNPRESAKLDRVIPASKKKQAIRQIQQALSEHRQRAQSQPPHRAAG